MNNLSLGIFSSAIIFGILGFSEVFPATLLAVACKVLFFVLLALFVALLARENLADNS